MARVNPAADRLRIFFESSNPIRLLTSELVCYSEYIAN